MNCRNLRTLFMLLFLLPKKNMAQKASISVSEINSVSPFLIVDGGKATSIYIDKKEAEVVGIAAEAFKGDINLLTGLSPEVLKNNQALPGYLISIGTLGQSAYIDQLAKADILYAQKSLTSAANGDQSALEYAQKAKAACSRFGSSGGHGKNYCGGRK
jgi:hypothetical protein